MCTPDVTPPFNALVAGFRSVGAMLDGWLNMLYVLILYGNNTPCPASMDVAAVFSDPLWRNLTGANQVSQTLRHTPSFSAPSAPPLQLLGAPRLGFAP